MILGFKQDNPTSTPKVLFTFDGDNKHAVAMEIYDQMLQIWNRPGPFRTADEQDHMNALAVGYHLIMGRWPPEPPTGPATWN
jgi:hypothetical protein